MMRWLLVLNRMDVVFSDGHCGIIWTHLYLIRDLNMPLRYSVSPPNFQTPFEILFLQLTYQILNRYTETLSVVEEYSTT